MPFTKVLLFTFLTVFSFLAEAQYDGELKFIGRNFINNKPLNGTRIKVMNGNKTIAEFETNTSKFYIISKGIDEMRINAKGYGEIKLLNTCGNAFIFSDDEHAVNRRLEFKLIFN